ncbi:hypothetical protein DPMN_088056 [Dreissena polymorpha]|uniref:Uncharacterized protein n=1 Tax=Dreissena polymorpha TaxID=45954 RepID=A0A9D4KTH4_DREPO|nr:hypothetical protein DPMN_088056 [Dreissena polymorpha]
MSDNGFPLFFYWWRPTNVPVHSGIWCVLPDPQGKAGSSMLDCINARELSGPSYCGSVANCGPDTCLVEF